VDNGNTQQWTLPGTGTYLVAVEGFNASATSNVSYKFTLYDNANPTTALTLNSEVTGTLANPGDQATYTFTGSVGQQIQFNGLSPTTSGEYVRLYDPLNYQVLGSYLYSNAGPITLTTPGTYRLVVTTNGASTGNYDFRLLDLISSPRLQVGATEGDLTVTLSSAPTQQVLIQYATSDGTATAAAGQYKPATGLLLFQPGQTTATVEVQAIDMNTTQATTFNVNLSAPVGATIANGGGTGVVTINANSGATLNGQVFNDLNGDGSLGGGEPRLPNVTINLLDSSNNIVAHTTTAANGTYSFTNITPGSYTVAEVVPTGYVQTDPPSSGTYAETVSVGQTINNLNFGVFQTVTIGGEVFNDLNGNGVLNTNDAGLPGVTVELTNNATHDVTTTTTDTAGNYAFAGLAAGTYTVQVVLQPNFVLTAPASVTYTETVSSGQGASGLNFGAFQRVTLSGEVYNDVNGNGAPDAGEPGISGWTIDLYNSSNQFVTSTTTLADGTFTFSNVGPGSYTVSEVPRPGYAATTATSFPASTIGGQSVSGLDFGQFQTVTLSGEVFNDLSGDGALQGGDPGLSGVTVDLVNAQNQTVAKTTLADGTYSFTGVGPGSYSVQVAPPSGFVATTPTSLPVTTSSGQNVAGLNFGEFQTVTVSGNVYNDLNGNGFQNTGEPGLANWEVDVKDSGGKVVASAFTDSSGNYTVTGVGPGSFTLSEVVQGGWVQTQPVNPGYYSFTSLSGVKVVGGIFGDFQTTGSSLSGEVFNDLNGNGALNGGDAGLSGWTVELRNDVNAVIATAITDTNGDYSFNGLAAGTYTLDVQPKAGYTLTAPAGGTYTETVTSGQGDSGLDFGAFQQVTVSGNVYNDLNGSGSQDAGEPSLSGWEVDVKDSGGKVVASAFTDSSGNYTVTGVGPGSFTLSEVVQGGWAQIQPVNPGYYSFTSSSGINVVGGIFGDFQTVTVSGEVFNDLNGDGALQGGEPGLSGVTVDLVDAQNQTVATTTLTGGTYSFANVGPGSYSVQVAPPSGFVPTTGTSLPVTTSSGQDASGLNFGEFQTVTVSGEVYGDVNGNGALDAGESGLSGWTIDLINTSTHAMTTAATDSGGHYSFAGVGPGSYTVSVVPQSSYLQTSSPSTFSLTTTSGQNDSGLNFGEFLTASILGRVFNDANANGSLDTGESGLANWTINLLNGSNAVVATTMTNSLGNYSFSGVGPGSYTIQEVTQTGYTATTATTLPVTATYGGSSMNNLFGEFQNVTLGGEVFNDLNGDGTLENGEPGLSGWTVDLVNAQNQITARTTLAGGTYSFTNVGPGSYMVKVVGQSGYVATTSTSLPVTTTGGQNVSTLNFGEFQTVTLGGEVYNDANANGSLDPGESGFSGWTVNLLNAQGQTTQTTTTDANGNYSFSNVGPGAQTIQEVTKAGYVPTSPATGTIALTPTSGTNVAALNLGNILQPQVVDIRVDYGNTSMSLINLNRDLPFVNINAIEVIFNEDVSVVQGDLALKTLIGSGVTYNFNSFTYNSATHDAKWTLPSAIGVDSLMLTLDGHHANSGTDGVHVGSGIYLGNVSQNFSVLPGDVNGDKVVNAQDTYLVQQGILHPATATVWEDVDGSGKVDFTDYTDVGKWIGKKLP
jgi:hypothetical protein